MLKRIRKLLDRRKRPGDETSSDPDTAAPEAAREPAGVREALPSPSAAGAPAVHEGPRVVHRPIAVADLDPEAVKIVRRLTRFDHQAYLVGGCVRDLLLERRPKDFDVGTSATPRQIKRLFRNCRVIGRRFRLAHIYFQDGKIIEVATFRARDSFEDGDETAKADLLIRDDNVFGTPEEDALRRDFTINALFYDVNDETVLDHTDGLTDLRRRLVRTIGDPDIRFREDPIRVLRAIKFAARLGFEIEAGTLAALCRTRGDIRKAAPPRVLEEINRFCRGGAARRSFELLRETEVLDVILPEVAARARGPAWDVVLALLERMDAKDPGSDNDIRTGTIIAVLLLPLVAARFGWDDPSNRAGAVHEVQEAIDDLLRPVALRLRIPRREQEYCRQLLATLVRLIPAEGAKRHARRGALARECHDDATRFLEALAARLGGEFATAAGSWATSATESGDTAEEAPAPATRGRRRGRRGGRRRRRAGDGSRDEASAAIEPAAAGPVADDQPPASDRPRAEPRPPRSRRTRGGDAPAPAPKAERKDLPPPWSDDYFFAALPSAPDDHLALPTRREEMARDAPEELPAEQEAVSDVAGTEARPARKRRPRRRRRKPAQSSADATASESPNGGEAEPLGEDDLT